jgi:type IV pilus assembly protein PilV
MLSKMQSSKRDKSWSGAAGRIAQCARSAALRVANTARSGAAFKPPFCESPSDSGVYAPTQLSAYRVAASRLSLKCGRSLAARAIDTKAPPMATKTRTYGFTMLEVLISIVVIAFGLLGIAGLQAFAIKNNHSASLRITATSMANDMIDRMKANYIAVMNGDYNKPNSTDYTTAVASCLTTAGCTSQQLAQNDLNEWSQRLAASLPNGRGVVCLDSTPHDGTTVATPDCDNTGTTMYVVKIWWTDDRTASGVPAAPQRFSWAFNP